MSRIYIAINDLLVYGSAITRPTGIQRVAAGLANTLVIKHGGLPVSVGAGGMRSVALPQSQGHTFAARLAEPALRLLARTPRRFQEALRGVARTLLSRLAAWSGGAVVSPQAGDWIAVLGAPWIAPGMAGAVSALKRRSGMRIALLVHDLLPATSPQWFSDAQGEAAKRDVESLIRDADLLCAVSSAVVAELGERYGKPATLLMPADSELPAPTSSVPYLQDAERIVLSVGTLHPRKNLRALVKIWDAWVARSTAAGESAEAVPILVLAGRRHPQDGTLFAALTEHPAAARRIRLTHDADDSQLAFLYRASRFLVMPSLAEGWGLPIREALLAGRPAIATDAVPAAVGSPYVHIIPAGDDDELSRAIISWWTSEIPEQIGAEIAAHFVPRRWPVVADELAGLLTAA